MELIGVDNLEFAFDEFLEEYGLGARMATDWAYCVEEEVVEFSLVQSCKSSREFMESIERLRPQYRCDEMLWSLMHEVGHHMTKHKFTAKQMKQYYEDVHAIEKVGNSIDYYNLPFEVAATKWAVNYINKYAPAIQEKWAKLVQAIMIFYKENNIHD